MRKTIRKCAHTDRMKRMTGKQYSNKRMMGGRVIEANTDF